uniref:Uncharacterized protein n=1 Tax=Oryza nivara TaxID=4536 RepID=A0A0E0HN72_ORYNI
MTMKSKLWSATGGGALGARAPWPIARPRGYPPIHPVKKVRPHPLYRWQLRHESLPRWVPDVAATDATVRPEREIPARAVQFRAAYAKTSAISSNKFRKVQLTQGNQKKAAASSASSSSVSSNRRSGVFPSVENGTASTPSSMRSVKSGLLRWNDSVTNSGRFDFRVIFWAHLCLAGPATAADDIYDEEESEKEEEL